MNETTINKLKNNPFYSPTNSQLKEIDKVETGIMDIHQSRQELDIHPTGMVKRKSKRRRKKTYEEQE